MKRLKIFNVDIFILKRPGCGRRNELATPGEYKIADVLNYFF